MTKHRGTVSLDLSIKGHRLFGSWVAQGDAGNFMPLIFWIGISPASVCKRRRLAYFAIVTTMLLSYLFALAVVGKQVALAPESPRSLPFSIVETEISQPVSIGPHDSGATFISLDWTLTGQGPAKGGDESMRICVRSLCRGANQRRIPNSER
jgi:hypothetical protein